MVLIYRVCFFLLTVETMTMMTTKTSRAAKGIQCLDAACMTTAIMTMRPTTPMIPVCIRGMVMSFLTLRYPQALPSSACLDEKRGCACDCCQKQGCFKKKEQGDVIRKRASSLQESQEACKLLVTSALQLNIANPQAPIYSSLNLQFLA